MDDDSSRAILGTPVYLSKPVRSIADAIENAGSELYQFASCINTDTKIFDSRKVVDRLRAFNFCAGCSIRVDHLQAELAHPLYLIVGGYTAKRSLSIRAFLNDNAIANIPQLDVTPTSFHFEFMANLMALESFIKRNSRPPILGEKYTLDPGTKFSLANGKKSEIFMPLTFDVGEFYLHLNEKGNIPRIIFQYEIADLSVDVLKSKKLAERTMYDSLYALWMNRNPDAKLFPLNTKIHIEKGAYFFDHNGRPYGIDETRDVAIGRFFAGEFDLNIDGNTVVDVELLEELINNNGMKADKKNADTIVFEQMGSHDFELFLIAFERWKEVNKEFEFIAIGNNATFELADIPSKLIAEFGINKSSSQVKIEVGFAADKIRKGEFVISDEQRKVLLASGFIFEIDEFIRARNFKTLEMWSDNFPDRYLDPNQLPKKGNFNQNVVIPVGTELVTASGEIYTLRHDNLREPLTTLKSFLSSRKYGSLSEQEQKFLQDLGVIWETVDFKTGILTHVGLESSPDVDAELGESNETKFDESTISGYSRIALGEDKNRILVLDIGTEVLTPLGDKYSLKNPVFVDMKKSIVYLGIDSLRKALGDLDIPTDLLRPGTSTVSPIGMVV